VVLGMRMNRIGVALGAAGLAVGSLLASSAGAATAAPAGPPMVTAAIAGDLIGVSCVSAKDCMAVGGHLGTRKGPGGILAERFNGKTWSAVATPEPSGADGSSLQSVSCTSTKNCVAAGDYDTSSHSERAFAEHWNGAKWSVTSVPVPKGASATFLDGTACSSATSCWASGMAGDDTLIDHWNGKKWSLVSSPSPHPAKPNLLNGLACASAKECWAVGYDFPASGSGALTEGWNGKSWKVTTTPSSKAGELVGVTCAKPSACLAVGIGDNLFGLAQRWTGSKWVSTPTPRPAGAESVQLSAVACTSPSACVAVGEYAAKGDFLVLAQRWTGSKWVAASAVTPKGTIVALLSGAACVTASNCWAVGRAESKSNTVVLIEHWNGKSWSVS
jgi:hypothetical protein